jgi:hypothetical protein
MALAHQPDIRDAGQAELAIENYAVSQNPAALSR